jgi:MFS family permease
MTVKTPDTSHVSLSPEVRVLVVARVVNSLGGFTLGFLPLLLVSAYDASLRSAGLVAASFGLATIPSRLLGGRLADVWDSRSVIVLGLAGCAVSQLALAAAPGIAGALAAAVVLGLCFEIYEPPSQVLLADLTEPDQRPAAYAALGAALAGAGVVAGLIAAVVAGVGLRWLFVADAATCLACAALVWFRLPSVRPDRRPGAVRRSPWRDPRLRVMLGVGTGFAILYMTLMCGLPLAVHDDGLAAWWPGVLVAVSAATVIAAGRLPLTRRGDAFSRMRAGYALLALGLALAAGVALAGPADGGTWCRSSCGARGTGSCSASRWRSSPGWPRPAIARGTWRRTASDGASQRRSRLRWRRACSPSAVRQLSGSGARWVRPSSPASRALSGGQLPGSRIRP